MSRSPIEKVEIVEPPIGELTKKHGGLKRSCFTGCGCVVVFIIAIIIGIKLFIGSGPESIGSVPSNFPKDIPLYDQENIYDITYISGKYKSRSMEIAGIFPKFILSPVLLELDNKETKSRGISNNKEGALARLWSLITTPVGDDRDTIHIEWDKLEADPQFVVSYYQNELEKAGYVVSEPTTKQGTLNFEKNTISGTFKAEKNSGSTYGALTVNYP